MLLREHCALITNLIFLLPGADQNKTKKKAPHETPREATKEQEIKAPAEVQQPPAAAAVAVAAPVSIAPPARRMDSDELTALMTRDRSKRRVLGGPGSAAHHYASPRVKPGYLFSAL